MSFIKIHGNRCKLRVNSISPPNRVLVTCIIHQSREENQPTLLVRGEMRDEYSFDCLHFFFADSYTTAIRITFVSERDAQVSFIEVLSGENIFFCLFTTVRCSTYETFSGLGPAFQHF